MPARRFAGLPLEHRFLAAENVSQIESVRPSAVVAPSIWYALVAAL